MRATSKNNLRLLTFILLGVYATLPLVVILRATAGLSFQLWLAVALPLVGFSFAVLNAAQVLGWSRAALLLGLTLSISLLFESLSVAKGWIYGPYYYSPDRLGPLFLGLAPYVIPLTWFLMLYPSYVIARRLIPTSWQGIRRGLAVAALGGLVMAAWDLVLDPLMTAREHWFWEVDGAYFGIPLQNYWGWWLTGFVILGLYLLIRKRLPATRTGRDLQLERLAIISYVITGAGNIGEAWQLGLYAPVLIGLAAMAPWVWLGWRRTS